MSTKGIHMSYTISSQGHTQPLPIIDHLPMLSAWRGYSIKDAKRIPLKPQSLEEGVV